MAELDIGQHCSMPDCKQLDFLPIACKGCDNTFCKNHQSYDAHKCSMKNLCKTEQQEYSGPTSFTCTFTDCSKRELAEVVCEACQQRFCLQHRHQTDHRCPKYEAPTEKMKNTKDHVEKLLAEKSASPLSTSTSLKTKKPLSKKARATAAKVGLMKIKMKAVGNRGTPDTEKIYFLVLLPQGSKDKEIAMFFSKKWAIGRVIDQIATSAGLENANNIAGAKKLCLYEGEDGQKLNPEETLEYIMAKEESLLFNGGTLCLQYVETDK